MIITIAFGLQIAALAVQIVYLIGFSEREERISRWIVGASALLLLAGFIYRSIRIDFFALTNTYESLVFFSFCIAAVIVALGFVRRLSVPKILIFGATFVSLVMLALASSPIAPDTIRPPVPALQSHWLVLHVSFSFIGEAFFVVAFVASIVFLVSKSGERRKELDRLTYTAIAVGYPIFTAGGLIFGAIWASYAWGSFWSWDPKETWALITWLAYTVYLHSRFVFTGKSERKKGGPRNLPAWISIIGFVFTMFTFFGVNFLLPGLHSYR